jgi:hypothetical protein
MITHTELEAIRTTLLDIGFSDVRIGHPWNSIQLEKDLGSGTLIFWMRDRDRDGEMVHACYSQEYEKTVRLAEVSGAEQAKGVAEVFEECILQIEKMAGKL